MKRYRVIAEDSIIAGHSTGEEFSHDFSEFEEWHLIDAGAIEVVKAGESVSKGERKES